MQKEQITEGNKLIAQFMGNPQSSLLYYDLSWDDLMPVVEKIDKEYATVRVSSGICCITRKFIANRNYSKEHNIPSDEVPPLGECNTETFILNVWVAVVQFIKWYNENK